MTTEPQTDYAHGYDLGMLQDVPGFNTAAQQLLASNADPAELVAGWSDGLIDSWLNSLRADIRSIDQIPRAYLCASITNLVLAFKTGTAKP